MEWRHYKALCDSPDVLSRWMLNQTLELLSPDSPGGAFAALRLALAGTLEGPPLAKPVDHRGGPATDMFRVGLSVDEARSVVTLVARAAAAGRPTRATAGRGLGGFVEAWQELVEHLEARDVPGGKGDVASLP